MLFCHAAERRELFYSYASGAVAFVNEFYGGCDQAVFRAVPVFRLGLYAELFKEVHQQRPAAYPVAGELFLPLITEPFNDGTEF